jgi:hypothetical protein
MILDIHGLVQLHARCGGRPAVLAHTADEPAHVANELGELT